MKPIYFICSLFVCGSLYLQGQDVSSGVSSNSPPGDVQSTSNFLTLATGPHTRTWTSMRTQTNVLGASHSITNIYVEVETGIHRKDVQGQWVEASDEISPSFGGATAANTAHQVSFAANANSEQALRVTLPDDQILVSHVLCLSYFDTVTGSNALIAELHDSIGQIIGQNQVLYTNALIGDCAADILYRNSKAGIEQNIVLRSQPPPPADYGISHAMLQVWTEFVSGPSPVGSPQQDTSGWTDEQLDFGSMKIGPGQAFLIGDSSNSPVRVFKEWIQLDGRTFLVEQVPLDSVSAQLNELPQNIGGGSQGPHGSVRPHPPKYRFARASTNVIHFATVDIAHTEGFLIDYNLTSATNFTFQCDTTYYVSGAVILSGTNIFEGGTVIKYATNASITVQPASGGSPVVFRSGAYRPVIFTAKDDNSVGDTISGSTGTPTNRYANPAIALTASTQEVAVHDFRISYAKVGATFAGDSFTVLNAQVVNCQNAIASSGSTTRLRNALFANNLTNLVLQTSLTTLSAENSTFSTSAYLATAPGTSTGSSFSISNSILANVTNLTAGVLPLTGETNGFWSGPTFGNVVTNVTYPFQTVGGGNYYLADNCAFMNAGTTNVNADLLSNLRSKTTHPPLIQAGGLLTTFDTTLSPVVQRQTGVPDLGFAYDPIDYEYGAVVVTNSATVSVTSGTVIAGFGTNGNGKSLTLYNGAQFYSKGTADQPVRFVEYCTVQERTPTNWIIPYYCILTDDINEDSVPPPAYFNCRFTDFSSLVIESGLFGPTGSFSDIRDCQFHGGLYVAYAQCTITNCLFERVQSYVQPYFSHGRAIACNSLFAGGALYFSSAYNTNGIIANNLTDRSLVDVDFTYSGGYNASVTNSGHINPSKPTDIFLGDTDYVSGPLGRFYYPTNGTNLSRLINAGSTNADLFGLYHFTTITNLASGLGIKETNSIVDIGFHYVATDGNGSPIDTDGDGTPDYLEDSNGNGLVDSGETDWRSATDLGLKVIITRPRPGSPIP